MLAYIPGPLLFGWYGLFLGPLLVVLITDFAGVVVPDPTATTPQTATTVPSGDGGPTNEGPPPPPTGGEPDDEPGNGEE